jgi:hypothetical protein
MMQQNALIGALPATVWKRRWTVLKYSLLFSACEIGAAVGWAIRTGHDSPLLANITIAVIGFATAAVLGYVFGASYDDKNLRDAIVKIGAAPVPPAAAAPPAVSIYPAAPESQPTEPTEPSVAADVKVIKADAKAIKRKVKA